jgi:colanic acid/amylovoran biosynthesis glycosyltransferase
MPICITFRKANLDLFPLTYPLIELYSWNIWKRAWRKIGHHIQPGRFDFRYDLPQTFEVLEKYNVKLLHAHFGYTGTQVLPIKERTGLPLVTTFYGEDISALPRIDRWRKAYQKLFIEGDYFLVEGPHMRKRLLEIGCPPEKAGIQRIAIYVERYPFRERLPKAASDVIRILFCGTFREKKGIIYALHAVRRVHEKFPNLEFRVIGDGELHGQVEEVISRYRMDSYTKLLGFQSHQLMIEEMEGADIFIQPSVTAANGDSEGGAPTTILEAQACGLPIVSTMHADIPNVVVPGESALLAPERDVETLSDYLYILLTEPERWARMGRCGRNFVEKYHNVIVEVKSLEHLYFTLASTGI